MFLNNSIGSYCCDILNVVNDFMNIFCIHQVSLYMASCNFSSNTEYSALTWLLLFPQPKARP